MKDKKIFGFSKYPVSQVTLCCEHEACSGQGAHDEGSNGIRGGKGQGSSVAPSGRLEL